jgi:HAD superfamily hydrolase (TIGR01509 family)
MSNLAIILDMDGLMVDSEPMSRAAWDQVLGVYGHTLDDTVYRNIIGHRIDETAAKLIEVYDLPLSVRSLSRKKARAHAKIIAKGIPAMPGLYELHARIAQHKLPWSVATSSPHSHAENILKQLGLIDSCRTIVGGDEVSRGKPAPDIYLLAAERMGISTARCLAIEDSAHGCRSALAAGMMVAAVPNGETKTADFSAVNYVFPSLNDVAEYLDVLLVELARR